MKVYTRKGDDGSTGLLYGTRVGKDSAGPSAYGEVDEAVSALGLARAETEAGSELNDLLVRLQRELFVAGAELATAPANRAKLTPGVSLVTAGMVTALEPIIDDVTARYDPPQEFVLPGENRVAAALDLARCVVRRAERASVAAVHDGWLDPGASHVVPYLNRLADLVYTLARWQEGAWRPVRLCLRRLRRPARGPNPRLLRRMGPLPHPRPCRPEKEQAVPVTATLSSAAPAKVNADVLAVPVFSGRVLGPGGKALDTAVGGSLAAFMAEAGFEGKADETLAVPAGRLGANAALLIGLGDRKTVSADRLRRAAAAVVRRSPKAKTVATTLLDAVPPGG